MKNMTEMLFDMWMEEHHPYHYFVTGLIYLILALALAVLICIGVFVHWYLKMAVIVFVALVLFHWINKLIIELYVEDFKK